MPSGPLPPIIERSLRAQPLLPSHRPLLDFFARSLAPFNCPPSSSSPTFQVICTLTPPATHGPAQLLQHRILALPNPSPPRVPPRAIVVLDSSFNPPTVAHLRMAVSAVRELIEEEKRRRNAGTNSGGGRNAARLLLLLAVNNADKAAKPATFEQRLAMMWAFARDVRRCLDEKATVEKDEKGEEAEGGSPRVCIDVALTTLPYFHEKSAVISESDFYKPAREEREGDQPGDGGGENGEDQVQNEPPPEQVILAGYDTLVRIFDPKYYGSSTEPSEVGSAGQTAICKALDPFFRRAKLRVTMRTDAEWGGRHEQTEYLDHLMSGEGLEKIGGKRDWASRIEMVHGREDGQPIVSSTLAREAAKGRDWDRLAGLASPEVKKWVEQEKLYTDST